VAKYSSMSDIQRWMQPNKPNPAMLRMLLSNQGYMVSQWCDAPEKCYGSRMHLQDQTHWIVSGSLEVTLSKGGESYILEIGDRDFIPANTYYSLRVIGEEPADYMVGEKL
jgi:mannose-6-phosphate isomerase-like protein (cupin superfamily)